MSNVIDFVTRKPVAPDAQFGVMAPRYSCDCRGNQHFYVSPTGKMQCTWCGVVREFYERPAGE